MTRTEKDVVFPFKNGDLCFKHAVERLAGVMAGALMAELDYQEASGRTRLTLPRTVPAVRGAAGFPEFTALRRTGDGGQWAAETSNGDTVKLTDIPPQATETILAMVRTENLYGYARFPGAAWTACLQDAPFENRTETFETTGFIPSDLSLIHI